MKEQLYTVDSNSRCPADELSSLLPSSSSSKNSSSSSRTVRKSAPAAPSGGRSSTFFHKQRCSVFSMRDVTLSMGDSFDFDDDGDFLEGDGEIEEVHLHRGTSSRVQTVVNIAKTCLGSGVIALPFAATQVHYFVHITGIIFIALWCLLCIERLLSCLDLIKILKKQQEQQKKANNNKNNNKDDDDDDETAVVVNSSGLGEVAYYSFGTFGLHLMNTMFIFLLFMILVAYLDACSGFVQDTFLFPYLGGKVGNVFMIAIIIGYLASADDLESLSNLSALGIGMIIFVFCIICIIYGDTQYVTEPWPTTSSMGSSSSTTTTTTTIATIAGFAQWYGTVVFGFGCVPLTYNLRSSMKHPSDMITASSMGLIGTSIMYIIMSVSVVLLFPNGTITGDVLQLLPSSVVTATSSGSDSGDSGDSNSTAFFALLLPTLVRLTMVGLVMTTAPLLVLPCGELIQDELFGQVGEDYKGNDEKNDNKDGDTTTSNTTSNNRFVVPMTICIFGSIVTLYLPEFVYVLSFVGSCWCILSFIIPPLFHLSLYRKIKVQLLLVRKQQQQRRQGIQGEEVEQGEKELLSKFSFWVDVGMLIFGIVATLSSSIYTFQSLIGKQ